MQTGSTLPGGDQSVKINEVTSAIPSEVKDGLLTESTKNSIKPTSVGPSNGLMEDLSVPNYLRSRGKDFLNVGNDALPKAPIGSIPPIPPPAAPSIPSGTRSSAIPTGAGSSPNKGGGGVARGSGSSLENAGDNKKPPPAVNRAPRRSDGKDDGITMGKLSGPPTLSPEKFFSDGSN